MPDHQCTLGNFGIKTPDKVLVATPQPSLSASAMKLPRAFRRAIGRGRNAILCCRPGGPGLPRRIFHRRRDFEVDCSGAAAVEFALVMPIFIVACFGLIATGIAVWKQNTVQVIANLGARCIALSGASCTSSSQVCLGTAAQCYILSLAKARGVTDLSASDIVVDASVTINDVDYARVRISSSLSLAGYSFNYVQTGMFPNESD